MAKLDGEKELDAIDHVAVSVKDIGSAVAWYKERFNCAVDYQDNSWAYLKFQNIRLALVVSHEHPAHIAFAIEQAERFGKLNKHRDGTRSLYIEDPYGNSVELVDKHSIGNR